MKRLLCGLLLALGALPMLAGAAEPYQAGRDYQEIAFPQPVETGAKIEVREFFWYGCPHCYHLEPALNAWLKKKPVNAEFVRTPGVAPNWMTHAQAFYAFESMGVEQKLHGIVFDAVQSGEPLDDEDALAEFASHHGVDPQKFRDAFRSFGVHMQLERATQLNQAYGINSVPTLVVDGKYMTSPAMAGGDERVMQVVDYLIAKAARERKQPARR